MKVGLWGARGDSRGLAHQTLGFAKHLDFDRIMTVDMTADDLSPYPCDFEPFTRYCRNVSGRRNSQLTEDVMRKWLKGLDVVLGAETFYKEEFITVAKQMGVKTILQINPEFSPWWNRRNKDPRPDVMITPSTWRLQYMPGVIHLPFPVDREEFPFRLRTQAEHFVHIAGHAAAADRAGTRMVIATLSRLRGQVKMTIRSQHKLNYGGVNLNYATIEDSNIANPRDLYADTDVALLPRRYGGQSLVANEALSSGCPIIVLDRNPDRTWGGAYPVTSRNRLGLRTKAGTIAVYDTHSNHLCQAIMKMKNHPDFVKEMSLKADAYADTISWDTLLPRYQDLLRRPC